MTTARSHSMDRGTKPRPWHAAETSNGRSAHFTSASKRRRPSRIGRADVSASAPDAADADRRLGDAGAAVASSKGDLVVDIERSWSRLRVGLARWIGAESYDILLERVLSELRPEHPALRDLTCRGAVDGLLRDGWKHEHVALLTTGSRHPVQVEQQARGQEEY